jgi:hypothetical protein
VTCSKEQDAPLAGVAAIQTRDRGAAAELPLAFTIARDIYWCTKYVERFHF